MKTQNTGSDNMSIKNIIILEPPDLINGKFKKVIKLTETNNIPVKKLIDAPAKAMVK